MQAEVLRRINAREWKPGDFIPNESELSVEFGCARATVNRALRGLAESGLLDRRRKARHQGGAQPGAQGDAGHSGDLATRSKARGRAIATRSCRWNGWYPRPASGRECKPRQESNYSTW
ncbi:GntR family transcriptional regulator [Hoeflea alexandrii]|uniref:GntR family transcriptional regulator n=1 Tax=Hoeflea alexandrii TaxID=288436 RepID=UPI0022722013|nr:GntR family transcriptional regulator [Hoeflea alexandrii]MCY0152430.1 GntR family transcriptional regulator [Hoeflea alexandrii]